LVLGPGSTLTVADATTLAPVGPPLVTTLDITGLFPVVSMSEDGAYVAVADTTGVEVIDVASGRATRPPFPIGSGEPPGFSPDGRLLLISDIDGTLHEIDLATGTERWSRDFGLSVGGTSWSSDGLLTATPFQGDPRVLDAATGADVAGPFSRCVRPGVLAVRRHDARHR
jgi:outer membrane protein assembly factor BamB